MSSAKGCPYGRIIYWRALKPKTCEFCTATLIAVSLWNACFPASHSLLCSVLLDIASFLGKQPFANPSISRSLTLEDIKHILDSVRALRLTSLSLHCVA